MSERERQIFDRCVRPHLPSGATLATEEAYTTSATPTEHEVLAQSEQVNILEQRVATLERILESRGIDVLAETKLQLRKSICNQLSDLLNSTYSGKYVAITYDGKILSSADTDIELLQNLENIDYPADQIFLHKVGSKTFAGWI